MNSQDYKDIDKVSTIMLDCSEDPRLNFTFMKQDKIDNFHKDIDHLLDLDKIDYGLKICDGDKTFISPTMPISLAQIKTIEEGTEWFKKKYPNLPSEYWSIMSKYYFKEPLTKKQLKNELKKEKKGKKSKALQGLQIVQRKVKIDFD